MAFGGSFVFRGHCSGLGRTEALVRFHGCSFNETLQERRKGDVCVPGLDVGNVQRGSYF